MIKKINKYTRKLMRCQAIEKPTNLFYKKKKNLKSLYADNQCFWYRKLCPVVYEVSLNRSINGVVKEMAAANPSQMKAIINNKGKKKKKQETKF